MQDAMLRISDMYHNFILPDINEKSAILRLHSVINVFGMALLLAFAL
jgi:hypothetical protein